VTVKLTSGTGNLSALTSPPPSPQPLPDGKLVHKLMDYQDRMIWVTVPFPDKISLITDLTNEIQAVPDQSGKKLKFIYKELDELLKTGFKATPLTAGGPITSKHKGGDKQKAEFWIKYAGDAVAERAHVTFQRRIGETYPSWSIRIEFNPFKAGISGMSAIRDAIEMIIAPFLDFDRMLGSLQITRVDAAVDCIGARPLDLIVRVPKPGKRMIFASDDGDPEAVYLYEKKPDPASPPGNGSYRTTGPLRLKLYERSAYQRQYGQLPTYGGCPVTRSEVSVAWNKNRPLLSQLVDIKNPFEGRHVGYAAAFPPLDASSKRRKGWIAFCLTSFSTGVRAARWNALVSGGLFAKWFAETPGDLVAEQAWEQWSSGVIYSGLMDWIEIAQKQLK
jgi:hypothetical protein